MKLRAAATLILLAALSATGQTNPEMDIGSVQVGNRSIPGRIEYKIEEALTNSRFLLNVIFTGEGLQQLQIDSFELQDKEPTTLDPPVTIKYENSSTSNTDTPGLAQTIFRCRVTVAPDAPAQSFHFKMLMSYPGERVEPKYFDLPIWPRTEKQALVNIDKAALKQIPVILRTNLVKELKLPVRNEFSSYAIYVKELTVSSVPEGIVTGKTDREVEIPAGQTREVPIELKVLSPDTLDLIKGFSQEPELEVQVKYQDKYGRTGPHLKDSVAIKVIPNNAVLFSAILIGVVVGTFVRFYLEFLARRRKLRRREVLKFVLYTAVFGLIVAAVALAGQVEIKALDKPMGSYDKPLAMFIIGLAAAIGGVQLIVAWYNSLRPKEEHPDA